MRRVAVAAVLVCRVAAAEGIRYDDSEGIRPDLVKSTATSYDPAGTADGSEERDYDATGHLVREIFRNKPGGREIARWDFTWDSAGRLASRKTHDGNGKLVQRLFTYKLDGKGRIAERTNRDPDAPAGEAIVDVYAWDADGSHTVQSERRYANEGPYRSEFAAYDAQGRITRHCIEHGNCSMYEYDTHGNFTRIREQEPGGEHHYRVYETSYDSAGRITKRVVNVTTTEYRYNARGDVIESIASLPGGSRTRRTYVYVYR